MKKLIMFVGAVALLVGANYAFSDDNTPTVRLEKKNTASLREEFTESSVDAVKLKLLDLSQTLPAKEHIKLFLNTPGGSVIAGNSLKTVMEGIKNPIDVIVQFGASMGYLTTQAATGNRYVTQDGILMAHRAELQVEGQTPGEIGVRLAFFQSITDDLAAMAANRTGVTVQDYQNKVVHEYWAYGQKAVEEKQADAVVNVTCSADLDGSYVERIYTMFGPVDVEWANCPLISGPISFSLPGKDYSGASELEYNNFVKVFKDMFTKPKINIVDDLSLRTEYHKYVR